MSLHNQNPLNYGINCKIKLILWHISTAVHFIPAVKPKPTVFVVVVFSFIEVKDRSNKGPWSESNQQLL